MTEVRTDIRGNGGRSDTSELAPPVRRRVRVPELAVGLLVMVGFSLAAVLWHMSSTRAEPAVAAGVDIGRGSVVAASDLQVVYLASDDRIARLSPEQAAAVIGRVALVDVAAGTLLTAEHVTAAPTLGPDEGVVGLALDPGQFPVPGLLPGDVVHVVTGAREDSGAPDEGDLLLASDAEVFAVQELGAQGRIVVSLKLPQGDAARVAAAAERGAIRLVLVGR